MTLTEQTRKFAIQSYVEPARRSGEQTVRIRVGTIQKELGWTNRTPSVCSTLSSQPFQREAGIELIEKRGGPASGGPSTTVEFIYRILGNGKDPQPAENQPGGTKLESLFGICRGTFAALGGGEEFLRREREWGPDAWDRYEAELAARNEAEPQ
jgi:hypothetical protein